MLFYPQKGRDPTPSCCYNLLFPFSLIHSASLVLSSPLLIHLVTSSPRHLVSLSPHHLVTLPPLHLAISTLPSPPHHLTTPPSYHLVTTLSPHYITSPRPHPCPRSCPCPRPCPCLLISPSPCLLSLYTPEYSLSWTLYSSYSGPRSLDLFLDPHVSSVLFLSSPSPL